MGRKAKGLSCSDGDKKELERRSRSQREPQRVVERARIILGLLDGETQVAVARHMGLRPNTGLQMAWFIYQPWVGWAGRCTAQWPSQRFWERLARTGD